SRKTEIARRRQQRQVNRYNVAARDPAMLPALTRPTADALTRLASSSYNRRKQGEASRTPASAHCLCESLDDASATGRRRMFKLGQKRNIVSAAALVAAIAGLGIGQAILQHQAEAQGSTVQAPRYVVDPLWPKPLPNNWLLGWTIGAWVDEQDHIWIIHRGAGGLHH